MALAQKVAETVLKYEMLAPGDAVLAGVSGGPDSVALLHALVRLKGEFSLRLEVAHVEHGIRGAESRADASFVAALADRLGLPFHLKELRLRAAKAQGNLEALAREERYRFFEQTARARGLEKIATGHTLDDQAETLLMRLFRGSGRSGMGAMAPVSRRGEAILIRPLIETSREEVEAYLSEAGLDYRIDATNGDPTLLRNWMRLEMLPRLKEKIDPHVAARLARLAEIARGEDEVLDTLACGRMASILEGNELLRGPLLAESKALQRRIIRLWLKNELGSLKRIGFEHIEAILDLVTSGPPQGRVAVPAAREVVRRYEILSIEAKRRSAGAAVYDYKFAAGDEIFIPEAGMTLSTVVEKAVRVPQNPFEAVFDLEMLPRILTVRNFRPGDRFQPLGMAGHKKLKDLFIEKRMPLLLRRSVPLLIAGEEILWIAGYGRSSAAVVRRETTAALRVTAVPVKPAAHKRNPAAAP
jgi:tRNA(Ile)-lysidine synthase